MKRQINNIITETDKLINAIKCNKRNGKIVEVICSEKIKDVVNNWIEEHHNMIKNILFDRKSTQALEYLENTYTNTRIRRLLWLKDLNVIKKELIKYKNVSNKKIINEEIILDELRENLGDKFKIEINDLGHNYNKSGDCTAFLLRKILEKLIYLVFAKNNILEKIEDRDKSGRLIGLKGMIEISSKVKIDGKNILMPQTAKELKGTKFLGDVAAHSPFVNVKMETITPQLPFIFTAYHELKNYL